MSKHFSNCPSLSNKGAYYLANAMLFAFSMICMPTTAQNISLATISENTLGISLPRYKYDEPGYMKLKATKLGFDFSSTYAPGSKWPNTSDAWFYTTQLSYFAGNADYTSPISGNLNKTPHWFYEARLLAGKDIDMDTYVLSPYLGVGYRHLFNDLGYERTSNYTTLPIGITHKVKLADKSLLHTTLEYMHLLSGVQNVKLIQNISMDQKSGFGLRFSMLKRYDAWSLGPTLTYWSLGQSEVGGLTPIYEPKNKTLELGIKGAMHF
jgi:hypothetical protein